MDKHQRSRRCTWMFMIACLSILGVSSVAGLAIASTLFATHQFDVPVGATEALVAVSSSLSISYVALHISAILVAKHTRHLEKPKAKSSLECFCHVLLRLLVVFWFGTGSVGVSTAFNQPVCRPAGAQGTFWQKGVSCVLHRISVATAVISLISDCVLLLMVELSPIAFKPVSAALDDEEASLKNHDALSRENLLRHSSMVSLADSVESNETIKVSKRPANGQPRQVQPSNDASRNGSWGASWSRFLPATATATIPDHIDALRNSSNISPSISDCTIKSGVVGDSQTGSVRKNSINSASSSMRSTYRRSLLSSMRRIENPEALIIPDNLRPARRRLPSGWMSPEDVGTDRQPSASQSVDIGKSRVPETGKEKEPLKKAAALEIDSQSEAGRLDTPRKTFTLARSKAVSGVHRFNGQSRAGKVEAVR